MADLERQSGFCDGSELPDDMDLDRMIYPERPAKPPEVSMLDKTYEQWQAAVQQKEAEIRMADERRDREFRLSPGAADGDHPGPPRTVR